MSGDTTESLETRLKEWASKMSVDCKGLSFDWLPPAVLLWLTRNVGQSNRLPPGWTEMKNNELLNDEQLDAEFKEISTKINFRPLIDNEDLQFEKQRLEDLKKRVELAKEEREAIRNNKTTMLELDREFNRELNKFERIKLEKSQELEQLTANCQNSIRELNSRKNAHLDTLNKGISGLLSDGLLYENQINDRQFDEFFNKNNYIQSYMKQYLNGRYGSIKLSKDFSSCSENINLAIRSSVKIEDGIWNYMRTKAELNQAQECFKYHLSYSANPLAILSSGNSDDFSLLTVTVGENDHFQLLRKFVNDHIGLMIHDEMKLQVLKMEGIRDEFDVIARKISLLNTCKEFLIKSLKIRDGKKEEIIHSFYSMVKSLISNVQRAGCVDVDVESVCRKTYTRNDVKELKEAIYKLFDINEGVKLEDALKIVDSDLESIKSTYKLMRVQFNKSAFKCFENKNVCKGAERFVWDGNASQPNIHNKDVIKIIWEAEKQNILKANEIKSNVDKLNALKGSPDLNSTVSK